MFTRLIMLCEGKVWSVYIVGLTVRVRFVVYGLQLHEFIELSLSVLQVAYHGSPFKAYEVFITALKAQYLEKGLVLPLLEDQNPAGMG